MLTSSDKGPAAGAYHHGDLRRALVASARELLREGGVAALTIRAAADRTGVTVAAPYRHFADKDALLAAVLVDGLADLRQGLDATADTASARTDPLTRLHALGHHVVDLALAEPVLVRLLLSTEQGSGSRPEVEDAVAQTFACFAEAIDEAVDAGAVEVASTEDALVMMRCVVQGLAGLVAQSAMAREEAHAVAERVMTTIDRGLLPR